MLVKHACQFVIDNLAGLCAVSPAVSHAPSMSDLYGQPCLQLLGSLGRCAGVKYADIKTRICRRTRA